MRVVDRSPSVPHTRPLDDRSASRDESPDGGGPLIEMCGAISMSVGSAYSRGVVRRRLILGSWPFQPAVSAMLVGMWGGDGGWARSARSCDVKVQVWRRWVNVTRSVMRCDGTAASVGGGSNTCAG